MADIVNRVLKYLFVFLLFYQLITSTQSELKEDDNLYETWSDVLADEKAILPADVSKRSFQKKRSIVEKPEMKVPRTAYASVYKGGERLSIAEPTAPTVNAPPIPTNDVCIPNPCQNGGTCGKDKSGSYMCACPLNYRGTLCNKAMQKCVDIGCNAVADCISAPSGAVCVCKVENIGRLCQVDIEAESEWEKVKLVISEQTIHTGETIVGVFFGLIAFLALVFAIHCHRVNKRRVIVRKRYTDMLEKGVVPYEPPPDWCEISSELFKQAFCCTKDPSLIDNYRPSKTHMLQSLSRSQLMNKQKEDELVRLLTSRTEIPNYEQTEIPDDEQEFPERIDQQIHGRRSSLKSLGMNNSHTEQWVENHRDTPHIRSYKRIGQPRASFRYRPSNLSLKTSKTPVSYSKSDLGNFRKQHSYEELLTRRSSIKNQQNDPVNRQPTRSSSQLHKISKSQIYPDAYVQKQNDVDYNANDDEYISGYASKASYRNNSARKRYTFGQPQTARTKIVRQTALDANANRKRLRHDDAIEKKMFDIKGNLDNLKKSISNRKGMNCKETNSFVEPSARSHTGIMNKGAARYTTRNTIEKYITETSSEEETLLDTNLLIRGNSIQEYPNDVRRLYPHLSQNGNGNARNGKVECSGEDRSGMYNQSLDYYQQHIRSSPFPRYSSGIATEKDNVNTNTENELRSILKEDQLYNDHSTDPSIKHNNLASTRWYSENEPGSYFVRKDEGNIRGFGSYEDSCESDNQINDSEFIQTEKSTGRSSHRHAESHQMTGDVLPERASPVKEFYQKSSQSGRYMSDIKDNQSEFYGVLSNNVQLSQNDQNIDERNYTYLPKMDKTESSDQVMNADRQYVGSVDNNDHNLYYMSSELASRVVYECQQYPDMEGENAIIRSGNKEPEVEDVSDIDHGHSSLTLTQSKCMVINIGKDEDDSLRIEQNDSEMDIEL